MQCSGVDLRVENEFVECVVAVVVLSESEGKGEGEAVLLLLMEDQELWRSC